MREMLNYDLSQLYVGIDHPEGVGFVESKPELNSFVEFHKAGDELTKVAILTGDVDSPFVRIKERHMMIEAVFSFLKIEDTELMQQVIDYKNEVFVSAWVKYLFILNEIEFTNWLLAKKDYEYFLSKANESQGEESDDKYSRRRKEYRSTVEELGNAVRKIEAKIFPDSRAAKEAALSESKKKINLYAEKYAQPFNYF